MARWAEGKPGSSPQKGCVIVPFDDPLARATRALLGNAGTSDIVDASVVTLAGRLDASILTADTQELEHLGSIAGFNLRLHRV